MRITHPFARLAAGLACALGLGACASLGDGAAPVARTREVVCRATKLSRAELMAEPVRMRAHVTDDGGPRRPGPASAL